MWRDARAAWWFRREAVVAYFKRCNESREDYQPWKLVSQPRFVTGTFWRRCRNNLYTTTFCASSGGGVKRKNAEFWYGNLSEIGHTRGMAYRNWSLPSCTLEYEFSQWSAGSFLLLRSLKILTFKFYIIVRLHRCATVFTMHYGSAKSAKWVLFCFELLSEHPSGGTSRNLLDLASYRMRITDPHEDSSSSTSEAPRIRKKQDSLW
jgi:hypothetical protein